MKGALQVLILLTGLSVWSKYFEWDKTAIAFSTLPVILGVLGFLFMLEVLCKFVLMLLTRQLPTTRIHHGVGNATPEQKTKFRAFVAIMDDANYLLIMGCTALGSILLEYVYGMSANSSHLLVYPSIAMIVIELTYVKKLRDFYVF